MRVMVGRVLCALALLSALAAAPVSAQQPAPAPAPEPALCPCPPPEPPPPVWTGSFGAGLALTQGNKDTSNFNLSFNLVRDPKTRTVFKADGLYILAREDGTENADRGLFSARVERLLSQRAFVFGQVGYVRDRFKDIDYLVAPTAGVGYKVIATDRTMFDVDTSVGMVFEKNTGLDLKTDGAVTAGERFSHRISSSAVITQGATALWKMEDFGDALYTFSAGLATSVTTRVQLRLEFQNLYKTRPTGDVDRNDLAFITTLVYKF
jgi:putative salt-induced outer membrane protein